MPVSSGSAQLRHQSRDAGGLSRSSTNSKALANESPATPTNQWLGMAALRGLYKFFKNSGDEDMQDYVSQLKNDFHQATAENEKLETSNQELGEAAREASAKEEQTRSENQALSKEVENLNAWLADAQKQLRESDCRFSKGQQALQAIKTEAQQALQASKSEARQALHASKAETQQVQQAAEAEANDLRQQLITFKISTTQLGRTSSQITDEEVRVKMNDVFHATQDFILAALRGVQLDLSALSNDAKDWLSKFSSCVGEPPRVYRSKILTSLVAFVLVNNYSPEYYFGLSQDPATQAATLLATDDASNTTGANSTADFIKPWLEPTRKLLAQRDEAALGKSDQDLIDRAIRQLYGLLAEALPKNEKVTQGKLRKIFSAAFELFRMLHHSKAVFRLDMARSAYPFVQDYMESVNSTEEESELAGRPIEVSVFPGIFKHGNEMGENRDQMTVVYKARVVTRAQ